MIWLLRAIKFAGIFSLFFSLGVIISLGFFLIGFRVGARHVTRILRSQLRDAGSRFTV